MKPIIKQAGSKIEVVQVKRLINADDSKCNSEEVIITNWKTIFNNTKKRQINYLKLLSNL